MDRTITIWNMSLKDRVKASRLAAGLSQSELARRIGRSPAAIHHMESGKTLALKGETLVKLASALTVSAYWLEHGSGASTPDARMTPDEMEAVQLHRALKPGLRAAWLAAGYALLDGEPEGKPSTISPYPAPKRRTKAT